MLDSWSAFRSPLVRVCLSTLTRPSKCPRASRSQPTPVAGSLVACSAFRPFCSCLSSENLSHSLPGVHRDVATSQPPSAAVQRTLDVARHHEKQPYQATNCKLACQHRMIAQPDPKNTFRGNAQVQHRESFGSAGRPRGRGATCPQQSFPRRAPTSSRPVPFRTLSPQGGVHKWEHGFQVPYSKPRPCIGCILRTGACWTAQHLASPVLRQPSAYIARPSP